MKFAKAGLILVHRKYHIVIWKSIFKIKIKSYYDNYPEIEIHLDTSDNYHQFLEIWFYYRINTKNGYGEGLDKYDMTLKLKIQIYDTFTFMGFNVQSFILIFYLILFSFC